MNTFTNKVAVITGGNRVIQGGTADGQKVEGNPAWTNGQPLFRDGE